MCANEGEGGGAVQMQGLYRFKLKYLFQSNVECDGEVKTRAQEGGTGWRRVSGVNCDRQ